MDIAKITNSQNVIAAFGYGPPLPGGMSGYSLIHQMV
jgi:hypothetical protein